MDDLDDTYDLRSFDALPGVDLTLWLRLALVAVAMTAVVAVVAL
jgi:hypothetical protein